MSELLDKPQEEINKKNNTIFNNDNIPLAEKVEQEVKDDNIKENENKEIEEKEINEEDSEEEDDIQLGAMGNNKIKFLSKEEINKMREKRALREEHKKIEKEKANARHRRMYLRKKNKYLKMLQKEKEEEENKYKEKEEEKEELDQNLSKKEKNKIIELKQIKEYYIGKEGPKIVKKKENKPKEMIKDFFVFDWKNTEDTTNEKKNYLPVMTPKIMFGKGIVGGLETKEDMKDYYNFDENERKKRIKLILKKRKMDKDKDGSKSKSESRSRSKSYEKKKDEIKNDDKSNNGKKDNKNDNNDKKKDKEQIKNEIKKRIMPKLNDGTKKFNWRDFNVIYKY